MASSTFANERARRAELLAALRNIDPALAAIPAAAIRELGVYGQYRGTYAPIAVDDQGNELRLVLSVLHTGRHYADDLSEDSLIYHFPNTKQRGRDASEVEAGKASLAYGLPIFVILYPTLGDPTRTVRVGRIVDVDDANRQFLIELGTDIAGHPKPTTTSPLDDKQFSALVLEQKRRRRLTSVRANSQARFAFNVFKRYGYKCGFCAIHAPELLDAAHIVSVSNNGSDDPRNGLPLCKNHHWAFDADLIRIDENESKISTCSRYTLASLGVIEAALTTLTGLLPHPDALKWRAEITNRASATVA